MIDKVRLDLILNELLDLNRIQKNIEFRRTKNLLLYVDEICIKISKNSFGLGRSSFMRWEWWVGMPYFGP